MDSEIFATQNILNLLDFFVGIQVSFSNSTYLTKVQVPITYNDSEMFEELMKPSLKIKKEKVVHSTRRPQMCLSFQCMCLWTLQKKTTCARRIKLIDFGVVLNFKSFKVKLCECPKPHVMQSKQLLLDTLKSQINIYENLI